LGKDEFVVLLQRHNRRFGALKLLLKEDSRAYFIFKMEDANSIPNYFETLVLHMKTCIQWIAIHDHFFSWDN